MSPETDHLHPICNPRWGFSDVYGLLIIPLGFLEEEMTPEPRLSLRGRVLKEAEGTKSVLTQKESLLLLLLLQVYKCRVGVGQAHQPGWV